MTESKLSEANNKPLITGGIDLVGQSFGIFSKKWKKLIWLMFVIPLIVTGLAVFTGIFFAILASLVVATKIILAWKIVLAVVLALISLACILISIFISVVASISSIYVIDQDMDVKVAFKKSMPLFWKYIGLIIVFGLITLIGYLLFIVPGIILTVMLSFSLYALILEDLGPIQALKRSKELVKGFWWTVLARFMVVGVFAVLISMVSSMINNVGMALIETGNKDLGIMIFAVIIAVLAMLVSIAINFVVNSIVVIYSYLVYSELKSRKAGDAQVRDNMSKAKKIGLGFLLAIPVFLVAVICVVFSLLFVYKTDLKADSLLHDISATNTQGLNLSAEPQPATPEINQ